MGIRKNTQRVKGAKRERMWWAEAENYKQFPESVACREGEAGRLQSTDNEISWSGSTYITMFIL